jgi:hypothetical protein
MSNVRKTFSDFKNVVMTLTYLPWGFPIPFVKPAAVWQDSLLHYSSFLFYLVGYKSFSLWTHKPGDSDTQRLKKRSDGLKILEVIDESVPNDPNSFTVDEYTQDDCGKYTVLKMRVRYSVETQNLLAQGVIWLKHNLPYMC